MIKQLIQTETKVLSSNTVIDCGNGDVAIGVADVKDSPKVLITFSDIPQQEVGSNVKNKDVIGTPVVVSFDSVESIKVLNKFVQVAMNKLKKKEEAANGIDIKIGNQVIKFTSDDIRLSYGLGKDDETGEKKFYLSIINGGKRYEIPAEDNVEAATMVKKITNVFDAKIGIAAVSTMNFGLKERLEEAGITVAYA